LKLLIPLTFPNFLLLATEEPVTVLGQGVLKHFDLARIKMQRWENRGNYLSHQFFQGSPVNLIKIFIGVSVLTLLL